MHNSIHFLSMKPISSTSISLVGFLSFATQTLNQLIKLTPWSTALLQTQVVTQMNNKTPHLLWNFYILILTSILVHSVEQKSIGVKFSTSRTGSDVRYSCHHNLNHFTFPIFAHLWRSSAFHSLQSITPRIY